MEEEIKGAVQEDGEFQIRRQGKLIPQNLLLMNSKSAEPNPSKIKRERSIGGAFRKGTEGIETWIKNWVNKECLEEGAQLVEITYGDQKGKKIPEYLACFVF